MNFAFIQLRWASPFWKTWDWLMLVLALLHGVNGLRVITLDYVRPAGARLAINTFFAVLGAALMAWARSSSSRSTRRTGPRRDRHAHVRRRDRRRRRGRAPRGDRGVGPREDRRDLQALPHALHTGAAQGGVCAALGNVEEDYPSGTPSTP